MSEEIKTSKKQINQISFIEWGVISSYLMYHEVKKISLINKKFNHLIEKECQIQSFKPVVLYIRGDDNDILYYDVITKKARIHNTGKFSLPKNTSFFLMENRLFMAGGQEWDIPDFLTACLEVNLESGKISDKCHLTVAKTNEPLVRNFKWLYAPGGYSNKDNMLDNVQKYSIDQDKWENIKPLQEKKMNVACIVMNHQHLYVFGGTVGFPNYTEKIELLHLDRESEGWQFVDLIEKGSWFAQMYQSAFPLDENRIVLFGGSSPKGLSNDVYIFNAQRLSMEKQDQVPQKKCCFVHSKPIRYGNIVYSMDSMFNVHEYNMKDKKWGFQYDVHPDPEEVRS